MFSNTEILTFHAPRPNKKLLVLDVDKTIADFHESQALRQYKTRPYLHAFLATLYKYYDIVIWSGTERSLMLKKIHSLGISQNNNFRLMTCLDLSHMRIKNVSCGPAILTKPLDLLWNQYPQYDTTNTIIVDDKVDNLYFHRSNGILITAYDYTDYETDSELYYLAGYLEHLARYCNDFSTIDHRQWPYYDAQTN